MANPYTRYGQEVDDENDKKYGTKTTGKVTRSNPYTSYGYTGKDEEKELTATEKAKQEREAKKKLDEEKKKKEKEKNGFQQVGDFLGSAGKAIGAGLQQGAVATADVALKGGSLINEARVQLEGGSEEEKNKKRQADLKATEFLRNKMKSGKDVQGEQFKGTSDDIGVNDLGDKQKVARLAGESLNVGLTATSLLNPTSLASGAARGTANQAGLSIAKGATRTTGGQAAKSIAKESALYGGLDTAATGSQVYGETGDPIKASVEGLKAGAASAVFQGALSTAGYATGRAIAKRKDAKSGTPTNPTASINVSDDIVREANRKSLLTFEDGKTAKSKPLTAYAADIDRRMTEVDTPEYQANNGLLNKEAGEARYQELMSQTENIPGMKEASDAVFQADEQLKYYNDLRLQNPMARKLDTRKQKIERIEQARQSDLANLQAMANDPESGFDPQAFDVLVTDANERYDALVRNEQTKIDEMFAKDPEAAAEVQMLDEAERTVLQQKMDAETAINDVATQYEAQARQEADQIAMTPNEERIAEHKAYLEKKKSQIEKRIESSEKRYQNPNDTLEKTVDEENAFKDGSHPLIINGANRETIENRRVELAQEKQINSSKTIENQVARTGRKPSDAEVEEVTTTLVNEYVDEAQLADRPQLQAPFNFLQQPTQYLRRMGLEKLSDLRTESMMKHAKFAVKADDKLSEYVKAGRKSNSDQIFMALDGDKDAYEKLSAVGQKVVDDMRKDYRDIGIQLGIPKEYIDKVDYAPHMFVQDGSKSELLKLQIKAAEARDAIDGGTLEGKDLKLKEKNLKELQGKINELIDPAQKVAYKDFTQLTGNVRNRFLEKRTGAEGYETNPYKAYSAYMDAANRKINFEPFMQQAAIVSKNLNPEGTLARFLKEEVRNMSNQKHNWDKFLDDGYNEMLASKGLDQGKLGEFLKNGPTKALRGFRLTTSMAHLGLSVNTAINTTAQSVFMPGSFGLDGTAVGMAGMLNLSRKLAASKLTKSEVADWKKMKEMGILEGTSRIIPEAYENPNVGRVSNLSTNAMKGIYAGVIGADRSLRMASYYGAKYIGGQKGLKGKELDKFIYEKVIETNQNFSRYEAPQAWRSHAAKMVGSMVNFIPGAIIRSSEIGVDGIKGAATIIGKYGGKDVTKGEFYDAVRGVSNALSFTMTAAVAAQAYESMTGQGEVIPNPFSSDFWSNPAFQFWVGNEATGRAGFKDLFPGRGDEYDEEGNNVTLQENRDKFVNETLPQYFIPGYSQWKRTTNAMKINEQGYSETEKGRVRYIADEASNTQRLLTGEYSTPEGRDYIENMGKPGGGSLNGDQSDMVKYGTEGREQQKMYYDFYKAADRITSRADANKEITELYKQGKPEAAKRRASTYNQQVEDRMAEWKSQYDYLDDEVLEELVNGLRIELTSRSEAARTR